MDKKILTYPPSPQKKIWDSLFGSSLSLAITEYSAQYQGLTLVITNDLLTAQILQQECQFFNPNMPAPSFFPDWETLPYDTFSPHEDLVSLRLAYLKTLNTLKGLTFCSATTIMHRLLPPHYLEKTAFLLEISQILPRETFEESLQRAGYHTTERVMQHGEYARRGNLIDLYPSGYDTPLRIEWFDDTIESLRTFDPETQRTIDQKTAISILPAREFPMTESAISLFRQRFRNAFPTHTTRHIPMYEAVSEGRMPGGIEYYLPLFFESTATFFDFLPKAVQIIRVNDLLEGIRNFSKEVEARYDARKHDITRPILSPAKLFLNETQFLEQLNHYPSIQFQATPSHKKHVFSFPIQKAPRLPLEKQKAPPLQRLARYHEDKNGKTLIVAESKGRREVLLDLAKQSELPVKTVASWQDFLTTTHPITITEGPIKEGFELPTLGLFIVAESQFYGGISLPIQQRNKEKVIDPARIIRDLAELQLGAPVVHAQFGVGRFEGLLTLTHDDIANDFLVLSYAGGDKIYVPITSLALITRYVGAEHPPLYRLGSDSWQKARKKAEEKVRDVAAQLLALYAKREAKAGYAHHFDSSDYEAFANAFPFEETDDQKSAIAAILQDLTASRPMDRLLCGDVGFGKTEVAMRAAFIAVQSGKQVCVLVPTTLLASQHFENFRDRFSDFPIQIELISRFRSAKEVKNVIDRIQSGKVDIVIGTHKLFSSNITFKSLGLLIIDEEHRFGVSQKERIKALKLEVDILSLTATPIPRTLNMAMSGMRDISLMATPPAKRLAIKTFWQERNTTVIREALLREILRGGQVFFVHNTIETIEKTATMLSNLVPEARVQFAHGQMRERELEKIMSDFYHQRFNVLVSTTIIETGIDIPTANTILIDRADHFGLAELHQLRGRVGRSHHQAYAYLLTPPDKVLSSDAVKRLEALVSLEDLGAGFVLATHDLEIRGAGELLGEKQSGNMDAIGFNLYMDMLNRAISTLKSDHTEDEAQTTGPDIDLPVSAIFPDTYISNIHERLILYKRMAEVQDEKALNQLKIELIDRFGLLPEPTNNLLAVTTLKLQAKRLKIKKIQVRNGQGLITFQEKPTINVQRLLFLIQEKPKQYQMKGSERLQFQVSDTKNMIAMLEDLLSQLSL